MSKKTDIYLCGTFRTEESRSFNLQLESRLIEKGYTCFLAQRDSDQSGDRKRTFLEDVAGIDRSSCIIAVGAFLQSANWGFELGYCYAKKKPVVVVTTSDRPIDLMIQGSVEEPIIVADILEIDEYFVNLLSRVQSKLAG